MGCRILYVVGRGVGGGLKGGCYRTRKSDFNDTDMKIVTGSAKIMRIETFCAQVFVFRAKRTTLPSNGTSSTNRWIIFHFISFLHIDGVISSTGAAWGKPAFPFRASFPAHLIPGLIHHSILLTAATATFPEFEIALSSAGFFLRHNAVALLPSPSVQHPLVIQGAQAQRDQRTNHVGADVERVEDAVVVEQRLDYLRGQPESEGHCEECEIERSATSGVQDPVEGDLIWGGKNVSWEVGAE